MAPTVRNGRSGDPESTPWGAALQRLLWGCAAALVASELVITVGSFVGDVWARNHPAMSVLLAADAFGLILCSLMAKGRWSTEDLGASALALTLATVNLVSASWLTWRDLPTVSATTASVLPVFTLQTLLLFLVVFVPHRVWRVLAAACALAAFVALSLGDKTGSRTAVFDECVVTTAGMVAFAVLMAGVRRATRRAELAAEQLRDERAETALAAAAATAEEEARRVVHDRVIEALNVIAAGRGRDAPAAARLASAAIDGLDPTTSLRQMQESLAAVQHPRVKQDGSGWTIAPPPRVLTAIHESVGEALRNAHRHGRVNEVEVSFSSTRDQQAVVTVRDRDVGLEPGTKLGFGLAESVVARMSQVGGDVSIASRQGHGTTVRLAWPHLPSGASFKFTPAASRPHRSRHYMYVFAPFVVVSLFLAVRHQAAWDQPVMPVGMALIWSAAILLEAWYVGRVRPSIAWVCGVAAFNAAATCVSWMGAPAAQLVGPSSWVVWASGGTIAALALAATLRQTVFLLCVHVATLVVLAAVRGDLSALEPIVPMVMNVAMGVLAYAAGALMRSASRELAVQEALAEAHAVQPGWAHHVQESRARYADQLRDDVAPFLESVATSKSAVSSADCTRALTLAARCRDLLAHSNPMPPSARDAVYAARLSGTVVNIRHGEDVSEVEWDLLGVVLGAVHGADAATLVARGAGLPARVVIIPPASAWAVDSVQRQVRSRLGEDVTVAQSEASTTFAVVLSPDRGTSLQGGGVL